MMNYTIIEDCSPYYIRFTYTGIEQVIEQCSNKHYDYSNLLKEGMSNSSNVGFVHHKLPKTTGQHLLSTIPMTDVLSINDERVSLFISRGGCVYRPHKDGLTVRCGINYNVQILDDACVTGWYDEKEMSIYPVDTLKGRSREAHGFIRRNHAPIKSMIAKQGECVLFNTDIYHDWNNSRSKNIRVLLTLRFNRPDNLYFEDARRMLFGF
jgi:hypothetical protein